MLEAMPRPYNRSISVPIVLSAVAVLLTVLVLVGWILVIRENWTATRVFWSNRWLMAGGIISLAVVMSVLVMFSVSLVREILEGRRQQTFIDSVTHELKSPLASIKLCLDTLAREGLSPPQREDLRHMMLTDVERLTVFVGDILEASRIAHGRHSQLWNVVQVPQLLEAAADSIRRRYELAPDAIQLRIPSHIEITTDPTALETVIKNILDNAVKYSTPPPQVELVAEPVAGRYLEVRVHDHGIGIEHSQLKRIFKRFHRVPSADVYERSGTGLGLYVVAALLRNLGGTVRADSAGPGLGTTFTVRLPLGISTAEATGQ